MTKKSLGALRIILSLVFAGSGILVAMHWSTPRVLANHPFCVMPMYAPGTCVYLINQCHYEIVSCDDSRCNLGPCQPRFELIPVSSPTPTASPSPENNEPVEQNADSSTPTVSTNSTADTASTATTNDQGNPASVEQSSNASPALSTSAVAGATIKKSVANRSVPEFVARLFYQVHGQKISPSASTYWKLRARTDKPGEVELRGAIEWHKLHGISH